MDAASTGIYNFQVRHPRCQTQLAVFDYILPIYFVILNNTMGNLKELLLVPKFHHCIIVVVIYIIIIFDLDA
jgi:hypothetical protein